VLSIQYTCNLYDPIILLCTESDTDPHPNTDRSGVIAGPLEMLYEFGTLDCQHSNVTKSGPVPTDELRRPIVLFGPRTSSIGSTECLTEDWHNETAANHVHTVLEGCDPATGIR
jgi:hypothetical protein